MIDYVLPGNLDNHHWHDRNKITIKDIGNTQYLACMNPTAGSFIINPRLQRHFLDQRLQQIDSTFTKGHFERLGFKQAVQEVVSSLIKATLSLHAGVSATFRKTAANFHYEFNIWHLSGVFSGLLNARTTEFTDPEKLALLWIHESERIYGDRLVSAADVKKYRVIAQELAKKMFGKYNSSKFFQEKNSKPLLFAPFSKGMESMGEEGGGV